ncbi:MAG: M28 family peptidase, partial [Acidobacteriota bacterium]|nr:M28 family peptidase [Acidobacteriota bacterium]
MFRSILNTALFFLLSCSILAQSVPNSEKSLMGFSPENAQKQKSLEHKFDASLKRENLRQWMKKMSARPHHVGSAYGKENAEFMLSLFKSWGFNAQIEQFDVLFPTPKTRVLEMIAPEKFTAKLSEPAVKEDSTSNQPSEQLPVYNAYSIDGDVTAPLVYVNYGVPADYEELERNGVDVKGKIVIARYGGSWRGIKPKVAAEHGAVGCLIYSDPRNDGFFQGDVYPKGAWRNENGAQRGSVADMPTFPGDPLTPNIGATKNAKRLDRKDAPTLTKIPVMPISYSDALPLLRNLEGAVVPESWRGALPITYHFGGTERTKVHLKLEFNWDIKPAYNVIAKMKGANFPDQWIIRGNHHDAWVNGADDPVSGMVALMEEARAVGGLVKTGWKPKRTIVYAAWDAEEPGLLGSTEWVETHADELKNKVAVYINSDSNGRGFLGVGGSHTLEKFVNEISKDVIDPQTKISVGERWRASQLVNGSPNSKKEVRERTDLRISALGSGSDYTPFLQHLGIASLNLGYGGEDGGGSYHSVYDSFDHYTRFGDTNFDYGIALA